MSPDPVETDDVAEPPPFSRALWDRRYAASTVWSGRPNRRLVEQVADLTPGRALDVGCGEGADVVWLAAHGWETTGVDVSLVALERTAEHAAAEGVEVRTLPWDALSGEPLPGGPYDLVVSHFLHLPEELRAPAYAAMAAALAPGGRLLIVAHHPQDVAAGVRRPPVELLVTPDDVVGVLQGLDVDWEVEVAAEAPREQEVDGVPVAVVDTVVRARPR